MAGNPNWTVQVPALANVAPLDPTFTRLDTSPYAGIIRRSEQQSGDPGEAGSIRFDFEVTEPGPFQGKVVWVNCGLDFNKQGNQKAWSGLMQSIGIQPNQMGTSFPVNPQTFENRPAYIYYEKKPDGEKGQTVYDNKNFITPAMYQRMKAEQAQKAASVPGAGQPFTGVPQVGVALPGLPGAQPLPGQQPPPVQPAGLPQQQLGYNPQLQGIPQPSAVGMQMLQGTLPGAQQPLPGQQQGIPGLPGLPGIPAAR